MFLYFGLCRNQTFNVTSCLSLEEASVLLFLQFPFHPGLSSSNPSPSAIGAACSFIKIATLSCTTFCKIEGIGVYSLDWHVHFKRSRGRGRSVLVKYFRCFFALFISTFLSICEPTRKVSILSTTTDDIVKTWKRRFYLCLFYPLSFPSFCHPETQQLNIKRIGISGIKTFR